MGKHNKPQLKKKQTAQLFKHPRLCQCSNCGHRFNSAQAEPVCPCCFSDEVDFVNPKV